MERDEETGLAPHGVRFYAPWLGRWARADPSNLADGVNRWAFVRGRPTQLVDSSGRASKETGWTASKGVAFGAGLAAGVATGLLIGAAVAASPVVAAAALVVGGATLVATTVALTDSKNREALARSVDRVVTGKASKSEMFLAGNAVGSLASAPFAGPSAGAASQRCQELGACDFVTCAGSSSRKSGRTSTDRNGRSDLYGSA